ncbi:MAG: hypothetical protein ACK5T5_03090 [Phenylobacterium sp.]|jgi:hypothetical protein|nr:hypothetical protein [Phenylobacterium sp.]MCA6350552.1 hypothetical protein [Phenylobacterium sp.]
MTPRPERRSPLRELFSFLGSALAGLRVLGRRPEPLPEVPATNGAAPPTSEADAADRASTAGRD